MQVKNVELNFLHW